MRSMLASATMAALAAVGTATDAHAQFGPVGGVWTAQGSTMTFTFVSREADFTHTLALFDANDLSTPVGTIFATFGDPGPSPTSTTLNVDPGGSYVLGLFVEENGTWFFSDGSSDPAENPEVAQSNYQFGPAGTTTTVFIEDLPENTTYCDPAHPNCIDFDDLVLTVTNSPEPASLMLMGTGLLGLAGFGVLRRRRTTA